MPTVGRGGTRAPSMSGAQGICGNMYRRPISLKISPRTLNGAVLGLRSGDHALGFSRPVGQPALLFWYSELGIKQVTSARISIMARPSMPINGFPSCPIPMPPCNLPSPMSGLPKKPTTRSTWGPMPWASTNSPIMFWEKRTALPKPGLGADKMRGTCADH